MRTHFVALRDALGAALLGQVSSVLIQRLLCRSIYDRNLAKSLRNIFMRHAHLFDGIGGEFQPELAANCRTIRDFDDAITRVSFGWPNVDAYYAGSGSDQVCTFCSMRMIA